MKKVLKIYKEIKGFAIMETIRFNQSRCFDSRLDSKEERKLQCGVRFCKLLLGF